MKGGIVATVKRVSLASKSNQKETNQPSPPLETGKKKSGLTYLVVASIVSLILLAVVLYVWWYLTAFSQAAQVEIKNLKDSFKTGWNQPLPTTEYGTNILILGLDDIEQQRNGSLLTDTMMVVSIKKNAPIKLLPIPRDLWIASLKTKVNALYYYGEKSQVTTGQSLIKETLEQILNIPIHHIVVVKIDTVRSLVNALDHVTVTIDTPFTDLNYPRDDLPLGQKEVSPYETVEFQAGVQNLDGDKTVKYIRSRQSEDQVEGSDTSRSKRQQKVTQAIIDRLTAREILLNPYALGSVYKIWNTEIDSTLTDADLVSLAKFLKVDRVNFETLTLPISEAGRSGILYHPPTTKYGQWVYEPLDPSWEELRTWIKENFN